MKRATRNAARTKQEIIEKAAPIFNVHGYAGTKMQMLIDATGYQMGGIYRHFESKMDLAEAVYQYNFETIIKSNLVFEPTQGPKEKLLAMIDNYKMMVLRPVVAGGCPLLNTATEVDDTNENFRVMTQSFISEVIEITEGILVEGQAIGTFQDTFDPGKEALYLFSTFEGAIMLGQSFRKAKPVLDIFDRIVDYLETMVFSRS